MLSSPDPPEYLEVEYNEGDDRDDTGAHQSSPVDVEPGQRFQQFFSEKCLKVLYRAVVKNDIFTFRLTIRGWGVGWMGSISIASDCKQMRTF